MMLRWVNFGRRLPPKVGHYCMPINTVELFSLKKAPQDRLSLDFSLFVGFCLSFFEIIALNAGYRASVTVNRGGP
jgi:hypothetical protein